MDLSHNHSGMELGSTKGHSAPLTQACDNGIVCLSAQSAVKEVAADARCNLLIYCLRGHKVMEEPKIVSRRHLTERALIDH